MIIRKIAEPSREDAVRLTRRERDSIVFFMNAVCVLEDLVGDLGKRLEMIPDGQERMKECGLAADQLLHELKLTIPMEQRKNLENTAGDYMMRLVPKYEPVSNRNILVDKEDYRALVDAAQVKCMDCVETDETCEKCKLFQLLTVIQPMEDYHSQNLCVYNMAGWEN